MALTCLMTGTKLPAMEEAGSVIIFWDSGPVYVQSAGPLSWGLCLRLWESQCLSHPLGRQSSPELGWIEASCLCAGFNFSQWPD
jgi:hypothetical protein